MRLLVFDNYDSFTYNIVEALRRLGVEADVRRNDHIDVPQALAYDRIIISPGPGIPSEAGVLPRLLESVDGGTPILGICLGMQAIGERFGGRLVNLSEVYHGVTSDVCVTAPDPIFAGLPETFQVGRYHSWVVSREAFPSELEITALSPDDNIMALRHRTLPIHGVQFHPESVMTPLGACMLKNFIEL